ncbi:hypothetical protein WR25_08390 [Diploscapter pachys]|uniref:B3/B4 tRNA-binding domain-containing protein n=1 Tax=Diploscapter pachys TaxID=2018661 RepID=A0A2A2JNX3_9BILA|nr:hypothetical protein WR25_08390 [Diploscapter pachys]
MSVEEINAIWPELHPDGKRYEIVLKEIKPRQPSISDEDVQKLAFKENSHINLLTITGCKLAFLSPSISGLSALTRLTLSRNSLAKLPDSFKSLQNLKVIDVSSNNLTELPNSIGTISHLESLNAASNEISQAPDLSNLSNLITLDLSHNKFSTFPQLASDKLKRFLTLAINHNEIQELPRNFFHLSQLKDFDISHNQLKDYPVALTRMEKLKSLNLAENPFKDTRFRKLANDKRSKINAIIAYMEKTADLSILDELGENQTKVDGMAENAGKDLDKLTVDEKATEIISGNPNMTVQRDASVAKLRPYLVCCLLHDVDLKDPETMKKFINCQTKLHTSPLCSNRTLATIGTHDADRITLPLRYLAMDRDQITALHKKDPVTGSELLEALMKDAELARKRTKRSQLNPLHRYLHLVKDEPEFACLVDKTGLVISLPPITNSDHTKLSENTTSIWMEVSSPESLSICRQVMEELIKESIAIFPDAQIEQVRVEDSVQSQLVSVFPDKNDLTGMTVKRV